MSSALDSCWLRSLGVRTVLRKYTDLGGYPLFYVTNTHGVLCADCATERVSEKTEDQPIDADVNYEDRSLYCEDCSERIESAYAEEEE